MPDLGPKRISTSQHHLLSGFSIPKAIVVQPLSPRASNLTLGTRNIKRVKLIRFSPNRALARNFWVIMYRPYNKCHHHVEVSLGTLYHIYTRNTGLYHIGNCLGFRGKGA